MLSQCLQKYITDSENLHSMFDIEQFKLLFAGFKTGHSIRYGWSLLLLLITAEEVLPGTSYSQLKDCVTSHLSSTI